MLQLLSHLLPGPARPQAFFALLLAYIGVLGAVVAGCASQPLPRGCDEVAFAKQAAACSAKVLAEPRATRQEVADACLEAINVHEDECHGAVAVAPTMATKPQGAAQ